MPPPRESEKRRSTSIWSFVHVHGLKTFSEKGYRFSRQKRYPSSPANGFVTLPKSPILAAVPRTPLEKSNFGEGFWRLCQLLGSVHRPEDYRLLRPVLLLFRSCQGRHPGRGLCTAPAGTVWSNKLLGRSGRKGSGSFQRCLPQCLNSVTAAFDGSGIRVFPPCRQPSCSEGQAKL